MTSWKPIRLRRLLDGPAVGGTWGSDPGEDEIDVGCVRGTDFEHARLIVSEERLPTRSVTRRDYNMRGLRRGDLVLEKSGGGEHQPVGRCVLFTLDLPCIPTNFACRLRPAAITSDRFLAYLLTSLYSLGITRRSIKQTTGIQNLDTEAFLRERVRVPDKPLQERIADFLDAETARIDALIEKKRQLLELLSLRRLAAMDEEIHHVPGDSLPLRRIVDRFVDYRGATPEKATSGVPLVTATNVSDGRVDLALGEQFVSEETYAEWMRRGFPTVGDVLLTTEAPLGEVAVIVEPRVALAQRLILLKPNPRRVIPGFLYASLRSPRVQADLLSRATGSTVWGIRADRLRDVRLRVPSLDDQARVVARSRQVEHQYRQAKTLLDEQIARLMEHRQALITTAVIGQLDLVEAA
jgi:type I restriction enzyme, S subunit